MQRVIVCAANKDAVGNIVLGARHFDSLMHQTIKNMTSYTEPWTQGFIDQFGVFVTREEAWIIATNANQIKRRVGGDERGILFSEHLY